ncbi:MAG: 3,4-dihydroxy-2-butanone-4-phosphate synthase [Acidobacteria bacterium]|jgi:3,4-dihydroxy 2-butanone 4-phosphate synthase/GTP cyclohydrolase II|nr:3,4-dihydroxy-2-butanone-4-phosphate synthase [Acidobacteriota bacterium]
MPLANIEQAIEEFRAGRMVIIVDDEDRENEGDLACAAEKVTPEIINFMAREGRGLICLPLTEERCDELRLPLQVSQDENGTQFGTAFTVSIEARTGVTTGISAADRAHTILTAVAPNAKASDLVRPGHIFPLRARQGGVLIRPGQTEASVDLARLAGLTPAGVICEIMSDDGTMARLPELERFAVKHDLKVISVADLIRYRIRNEICVRRAAEAIVPTIHGEFTAIAFENLLNGEVHLAMVMGNITPEDPVLVRVHTQSVLSDVFGSLRDSHGAQLQLALAHIKRAGCGIVLYLKQEAHGVGLADQLRVYREPSVNLREAARETSDAETARDPMRDVRDYGTGAQILHDLGVRKLRLLSNRPPRLHALEGFDLEIVGHVPLTT